MIFIIRPAARDDIIRQYRWYLVEKDAPEIAFRFLDAVEKTIEQLVLTPGIGSPKILRNSSLAGLRVSPVDGFREMRIFYLVQGDTLKVVRILHGKRDTTRLLEADSASEETIH